MRPMKAYLNIAKLRVNVALKRKSLSNYPVLAVIDPTLFCNLRCPNCPTGLRLGLRPPVAISEELFRSIIDEIGDYLLELWLYNWGEPLLHKQTPELIKYAKQKEMKVIIHTNLSMRLTDEYVESLVKSGLDELVVSLDGATEETYSRYRRGGDISLVRENMMRIQSAKRAAAIQTPTVFWKFLVWRHNEHEVEMARSCHRAWGADSFVCGAGFMPPAPHNDGLLEPSTLAEFVPISPPVQDVRKRRGGHNHPCLWLYGALTLNANGSVSPCCGVWDEGDDFAQYSSRGDFFYAWNSDKFKKARSLFQEERKGNNADAHHGKGRTIAPERPDNLPWYLHSANDNRVYCQRCELHRFMPWFAAYPETVIHQAFYQDVLRFKTNKGPKEFRSLILWLTLGGFLFSRYFWRGVLHSIVWWKQERRKQVLPQTW